MNQAQLLSMVQMQDRLNTRTAGKDWVHQNLAWHRAIWIECAELADHVGWKWWKEQNPRLVQAQVELVDIWHFVLSLILDRNIGDHKAAAMAIEDHFVTRAEAVKIDLLSHRETPRVIEELALVAIKDHSVSAPAFLVLMDHLELPWDKLYRMYTAKNVLNWFRQENGYREGTYIKTWGGEEDNLWLEGLMHDHPDATADELYAKLEEDYAEHTRPA